MSKEFSDQLIDLMNYFIGLRFKKQEICRKQIYALPTTLEEYNEQKADLEAELQKLKNQRDFMAKSHSPASSLEKIDKDISKIQDSLIEMKKFKPMEATSILSPNEIETLNTKYLPILKKFYEAAKAFILGNKNAFLETKPEEPKVTPAVTPQEQPQITHEDLEALIKAGDTKAVLQAIENGQTTSLLVYKIAIRYKKMDLAEEALKWHLKASQKRMKEREDISKNKRLFSGS